MAPKVAEGHIEPCFGHSGNNHSTDSCDICLRRSREAGKQHTNKHIDMPQSAADVSDPGVGNGHQPVSNAAIVHQSTNQHKKGYRQERV